MCQACYNDKYSMERSYLETFQSKSFSEEAPENPDNCLEKS